MSDSAQELSRRQFAVRLATGGLVVATGGLVVKSKQQDEKIAELEKEDREPRAKITNLTCQIDTQRIGSSSGM